MRVLVDSHVLLWFVQGDSRTTPSARSLLDDPVGNELLVSVATCWEIAIKSGLGRLGLRPSYASFIRAALQGGGFRLLPIDLRHTEVVASLSLHHRDPFDRMLIAQAIAEDVPIVSADAAFDAYPVRRLW